MENMLKSQQLTIPELWCNPAKTELKLKSLNLENTAVTPYAHRATKTPTTSSYSTHNLKISITSKLSKFKKLQPLPIKKYHQ